MAQAPLALYLDVANKAFVKSFTDTSPGLLPAFYFGDAFDIYLYPVTRTGLLDAPLAYVTLDGDLLLTLGRVSASPLQGSPRFTFGADTTAALSGLTAPASEVQTALNALASITAAGGVSVTSPATGQYRVTFGAVGERDSIGAVVDDLYPPSLLVNEPLRAGSGSVRSVQGLRFATSPAGTATWTAISNGYKATLNLRVSAVYEMLAGKASVSDVVLEISQTVGGNPSTLIQQGVTVRNVVRDQTFLAAEMLDVGYPPPEDVQAAITSLTALPGALTTLAALTPVLNLYLAGAFLLAPLSCDFRYARNAIYA